MTPTSRGISVPASRQGARCTWSAGTAARRRSWSVWQGVAHWPGIEQFGRKTRSPSARTVLRDRRLVAEVHTTLHEGR